MSVQYNFKETVQNSKANNNISPQFNIAYTALLGPSVTQIKGSGAVQKALNPSALKQFESNITGSVQVPVPNQELIQEQDNNVARFNNDAPFINFRSFGANLSGQTSSNLETNAIMSLAGNANNATRGMNNLSSTGVSTQNKANKQYTFATQTISNITPSSLLCTSDSGCIALGANYTCDPNYSDWKDSKGVQTGATCKYTVFPELMWTDKTGVSRSEYNRKNADEGGIGASCKKDSDCADGYDCVTSSEEDIFGSGAQIGYCAQKYICPDNQVRYLQAGINATLPLNGLDQVQNQNNGGRGYRTKDECIDAMQPLQKCKQLGDSWFAVFPGYCPLPVNRVTSKQQNLAQKESGQGISLSGGINGYSASVQGSSKGLKMMSMSTANKGEETPLKYIMKNLDHVDSKTIASVENFSNKVQRQRF
jgi:hypothetical protein